LAPFCDQHRVGHEQAGRFHVGDEQRTFVLLRNVARQHDADLVGEISSPVLSDHAKRSPSPSKAERHVGVAGQHCVAHACSIFRSSVLGL